MDIFVINTLNQFKKLFTMKKNLLTIVACASLTGSMFAQLPVSTSPQNRKAVIEEFTGIYCGYCPDGHATGTAIKTSSPTQVVLINVHSGGYANVAVGEPDLKTAYGNAVDPMAGMLIAGYPAGDVNRGVWAGPQTAGGMAQDRTNWAGIAAGITALPSYVNVALEGVVNATTRVLTVTVQVYYTANSPVGTNSLTVLLLESKILGPQHNYGTPTLYNASNYNPDGSYNHNHAVRAALSPNFGITIPVTTAGTTFTTVLTYTIPPTYGAAGKTTPCMLGNLELAAFVTETDRPIVSAANGPVTLATFASSLDISTSNLITPAAVCSGTNSAASFIFSNLGSSTVTSAVFSYAVNGGAPTNYTWSGSVAPQTQALRVNLPPISFIPVANNTIAINVVSVNGGTDQVAGNNPIANNAIPLLNVTAPAENMQMDFTQDQYGTEDSWKVYDEITNAVISQDGPFTNLGAAGTLLHTKTFTVTQANNCYKLVVLDAYGDGVNGGFGVGGYVLKSGGTAIITSNGQYGSMDTKLYKTAAVITSMKGSALYINNVGLYPNPTVGSTNLSIELSQNETVNIAVLNSIGQQVYASNNNNLNAGQNTISLNTENWAAGVYFVNVSTPNGSVNHKLNVTK